VFSDAVPSEGLGSVPAPAHPRRVLANVSLATGFSFEEHRWLDTRHPPPPRVAVQPATELALHYLPVDLVRRAPRDALWRVR
jgi:hypothetical protein